jgi:integrase/recombinase XerD
MRDERGLSPVTIYAQLCRTTEFLRLISDFRKRLDSADIETIDNILKLKSIRHGLSRVSMQRYVSDIRSFLRYAENQNWCRKGLANALPPCRVYRNETLPANPSWELIDRLSAKTDAQGPCELRNRAIFLLLALYGLRSSEVRRICLEDVDWKRETLLVRRTKPTQDIQAYPLLSSVAEAIAEYLKSGRPKTAQRYLFLRARAPYLPLSSRTIWKAVNQRLGSLNVPMRHHGPHVLRHACASKLLASGFSIEEIGRFLGHHSLDSTSVYAKVDLASLRRVAELDVRGAP